MRRWWWLGLLVPAAFVTRALEAGGALLYPDGYQYLLMAKGIAAHGRPIVTLGHGGDVWLPSADASVKPLFPALVALLHLLGLSLRTAAEIVTIVASGAVCVLVGLVAKRLTGSGVAALAAGALCVASPALGHWVSFSGPDPLAQALALGAALALLHRRPVVAGLLAGVCVTARPEYAVLALPVCLLSVPFAAAACAGVAAVLAAVRPPLALNTASATIAGAVPHGASGLFRSDWPLLVLGVIGLVCAPRRHAVVFGAVAAVLGGVYVLKDPGSARYFASFVPLACVGAAYAFAARRGWLLAASSAAAAIALPHSTAPPADSFASLAGPLAGSSPVYTAAPDAYGLVVHRPVRFLRAGSRGLILLDGVQRTYEPRIAVCGRVVRRIVPTVGFVRPDGLVDDRPLVLVRGTAIAAERRTLAVGCSGRSPG